MIFFHSFPPQFLPGANFLPGIKNSSLSETSGSRLRTTVLVEKLNSITTFTCQATVRQNETAHSDVIEPFGLHVC